MRELELPASIEAERTILGAILLDNDAYGMATGITPQDFSLMAHQLLFRRMGEMILRGQVADIITLSEELSARHEIEAVGGIAWLSDLTSGLPRRLAIDAYVRIVRDKALLRRLIQVCSDSITRAADQSEHAGVVIVQAVEAIEALMNSAVDPADSTAEALTPEVMANFERDVRLDKSPGISTGIDGLDRLTGGIMPGHQWALGARSSVGKTTALAQMTKAACEQGKSVSLYLLEPTRDDVLRKLWSLVSGVRYTAVLKPWLASREERESLRGAAQTVAGWNLRIFDTPGMSLEDVLAWMRKFPADLNGMDYIQRLRVRAVENGEQIRERIARASTALADAVKGTKSANVILSQLSRKQNVWDTPTMQDFRESSQIENDAHVIVMLHRQYDQEAAHYTNEGYIIVPKVRFGTPGNIAARMCERMAKWEG